MDGNADGRHREGRLDWIFAGAGLVATAFAVSAVRAQRRSARRRVGAEAQLEKFFSLSLDFLCISSVDGYFKRVSPAVTDTLGWSVEEFLAIPYLDLVHPEDIEATRLEVEKQVVAGQKIMYFENRYRHKDGSWRVLAWRSMPQPDGLMYATARDVTELKRAEAALREANERAESRVRERTAELAHANVSLRHNERRFRALIEQSGDGIAMIGPENQVLYLSPSVAGIEGYDSNDQLGRAGTTNAHPDDLPMVEEVRKQIMAQPGKPVPITWRHRHKDGRWIWLEGVVTNLLDDPAVQAIVTNYRDITQRKQDEVRLHAQLTRLGLLSQITRAIGERQDMRSIFQVVVRTIEAELPVDFSCICLAEAAQGELIVTSVGVNSEALAMELAMTERARVPVGEDSLARCVRGELVYEPDLSQAQAAFAARLVKADLHAMVAAPLRVESKVFGVLIVARLEANSFSSADCEFLRQLSEHVALATHQAQLYESLQKAYDDLRQSQQAVMQHERLRALGQMASGIAHDINNAISPIALYTESMLEREPGLSPRARDQLRTIHRAIDDVAQTVTRMREFYRQREPQLALAPLDINGLAQQVLDLTRARWSDMAHQRGIAIELRTELAAGLPPIMGAENEIREALTNLVFNAVDAMPQGGTLTLRTRVAGESGARRVVVEVGDSGIGMDDDTRRRCLEPFFTTKGERGTGLGLAMVYGAMQRHNAEIEIDSTVGVGTTVRLCFALADAPAPGVEAVPAQVMPPALRILLVDDDPVLLKSLRDILEADAHRVTVSDGGQAGIDAFRKAHESANPFDIVVTDLGMPYVDGRKVAAALKEIAPLTPIIMLTGWGQRLLVEGDIPQHVDRVLSKPPKLRELRETLAALTAR